MFNKKKQPDGSGCFFFGTWLNLLVKHAEEHK